MRRLCAPIVRGHGGQLLRVRGRAASEQLFAAFFTPEAAVNAARAMQETVALDNFQHDPPDRIDLTIGVATGRVLAVADEEVWGHAVNIASWLEQTARPGEILLCPETNAALRTGGEAHQVEVSGYWLTFYRIDAPALGTG
jgi:class 3 adenylate cyclase